MPESQTLNLPSDWYVSEVAGGGVDLKPTAQRRKSTVATAIAVLALLEGWKTLAEWDLHSKEAAVWIALTLFLAALALWTWLAEEAWHLERNLVLHRVGIGWWGFSRSYRDAELEIILRFTFNWNNPYYRLYAVMEGKRYFLMERKQPDLQKLANFIAFHTGWQVPSQPPVPVNR
jgi:hypothetical protein